MKVDDGIGKLNGCSAWQGNQIWVNCDARVNTEPLELADELGIRKNTATDGLMTSVLGTP